MNNSNRSKTNLLPRYPRLALRRKLTEQAKRLTRRTPNTTPEHNS